MPSLTPLKRTVLKIEVQTRLYPNSQICCTFKPKVQVGEEHPRFEEEN